MNAVQHHSRAAEWLGRRNLVRFELGFIAAWHAGVGFTIAFAPREQVVTPGTAVIFGTIPPPIWVAWFLLVALAAGAATIEATAIRLWLTWCGAFPLGIAWIYGASAATVSGNGNAIFALLWPALLFWWAITAVRLYLGGKAARWDGS